MRSARQLVFLLFVAAATAVSSARDQQQNQSSSGQQQAKGSSHLYIDSGELLSANGLPIHVSRFDAIVGGDQKVQPREGGKKTVVTIHNGVAFLSRDAITKLLNSHLASGNIKDLSVTTETNKVTIKGKAHKAIDVPFEIDGPVTATPDGMIKLQVSDEHAAHLPKGLSKALGFNDLSKMISSNAAKGIKADKNSVTFDPDLMWGLPIHGRVVKAATTAKGLLLTFGPDFKGGASQGR
jgi:hypothetical protein